jgi:hypothetical protein
MTRHGQHTDGPWEVQPYQADHGASLAIVSPDTGFTVALIPFDPDMQTDDNPTHDTSGVIRVTSIMRISLPPRPSYTSLCKLRGITLLPMIRTIPSFK